MVDQERHRKLKNLFRKYYRDEISPIQEEELKGALAVMSDEEIAEILEGLWEEERGEEALFTVSDRQRLYKRIEKKTYAVRPIYWAAAAIVLALLGGILYVNLWNDATPELPVSAVDESSDHRIGPGTHAATFTTSDGEIVDLTHLQDNETAFNQQGGIRKTGNGIVSYHPDTDGLSQSSAANNPSRWNELRTPYGGQYQLVLPDGTRAWVNANSRIAFPSTFNQDKREVRISGEVYFEVSHDVDLPFLVKTGDTDIEVLGTSFNVSKHGLDEHTVTTLIEGSVQVKTEKQSAMLRPGQHAVTGRDRSLEIDQVDNLSTVIGWKDGVFVFDDTDIKEIMGQIARWYNVEVVFAQGLSHKKLTGTIDRSVALDQILEMLTYSGLHFNLEKRKITVSE